MASIIFGPTGRVGSATAVAAHANSSEKVYLAMRDTSKTIPGLSSADEQAGRYERIQADLTQPDSVAAAVRASGAKRAFFYLVFGSPDHMKATIQAMKSAGVEFAVFLSSFSVEKELREITPDHLIPFMHAQAEINLQEIFGLGNFAAVRPAFFASNSLWWKEGIAKGEVKLAASQAKLDLISPADVGELSGIILVKGLDRSVKDGAVWLAGPEAMVQDDVVRTTARALGKEVKITRLSNEDATKVLMQERGLPEPAARNLVEGLNRTDFYSGERAELGVQNFQKYTGKQRTSFASWLEANKHEFAE